jgi:hypothetical protein
MPEVKKPIPRDMEQAAIGKRINRTGGRTSQVAALSGKSEAELQTIIRTLKNKNNKTVRDKATILAAQTKLDLLRAKESAELGKSNRNISDKLRKPKPVSLSQMVRGKPDSAMNRGGLVKVGNTDMRKGGMFR